MYIYVYTVMNCFVSYIHIPHCVNIMVIVTYIEKIVHNE